MDMRHPSAAFLDATRTDRATATPLPEQWRGLAERFAATHALRQVLNEEDAATPQVPSGSFDSKVARALANRMPPDNRANDQACRDVNPLASTDGKLADGKDTTHAGPPSPATEG